MPSIVVSCQGVFGGDMNTPWLDLVNSEWYDGYGRLEDRLEKPEWVAEFAARWGFAGVGAPNAKAKAALLRLRSLLRRTVEGLAAGELHRERGVAALNAVLARAPMRRRLVRSGDHYQMKLMPLRRSWGWVLAEIAASAAESLTQHDLRRFKVCANPGCRWAFYDRTKGRTRRWCKSSACGNLDKVRRFRERQRKSRS